MIPLRLGNDVMTRNGAGCGARAVLLLLGSTALSAGLLFDPVAALADDLAPRSATSAVPMAYPSVTPPTMPSLADQTWHLDMIGAQVAYGRNYTGAGVAVAVGDTGFDIFHPALAGKLDLARGYTNLVVQGNAYDPRDVDIQIPKDSHGTHVAASSRGKRTPRCGTAMASPMTPPSSRSA